jgi:hypothetical protein
MYDTPKDMAMGERCASPQEGWVSHAEENLGKRSPGAMSRSEVKRGTEHVLAALDPGA